MAGSVGQPTQAWFPWVASKGNTNWTDSGGFTPINTHLGMGRSESDGTQNAQKNWDIWLDSVTYKFCQIHVLSTATGIYTISLDGVSQGTIDGYGALAANTYSEITGLSATTPAVKNFKITMATKNASSSGYTGYVQSVAWVKTSGTHSTPAGTDTPGYTWEWIGWMGSKDNTQFAGRQQSSARLGGGMLYTTPVAQNNQVNTDAWIDTGTYKIALVYYKANSDGIHTIRFDSTDLGTIDAYAAGASENNYSEITGISVATAGVKNVKDIMATKNASSADYEGAFNSLKVIRTGA